MSSRGSWVLYLRNLNDWGVMVWVSLRLVVIFKMKDNVWMGGIVMVILFKYNDWYLNYDLSKDLIKE